MAECKACACTRCDSSTDDFNSRYVEFNDTPGQAQQERVKKLAARAQQESVADGFSTGACAQDSRETRLKARRDALGRCYAQTYCNVTVAASTLLDAALITTKQIDNPLSPLVAELTSSAAAVNDLQSAYFEETNPSHWATKPSAVYGSSVAKVLATGLLKEVERKRQVALAEEERIRKELFSNNNANADRAREAERAEFMRELVALREDRARMKQDMDAMRAQIAKLCGEPPPLQRNPNARNNPLSVQQPQLKEKVMQSMLPVVDAYVGFTEDQKESERRLAATSAEVERAFAEQ